MYYLLFNFFNTINLIISFPIDSSQESVLDLTEEAANFLSEQLKVISLPELTSVEQAQLLALIDTLIQVNIVNVFYHSV